MPIRNITEDGDKTLFPQQQTFVISSPRNEFPPSTNVLVVDANLSTLLDIKENMERCAYQVTAYADAEEAIAFLTKSKHEINIVLWDYHMPGINGLKALAIIRSKMDLPIIIMSNDDQEESMMDAVVHGACHYVRKPVRKEIIATIWQHILRKRMMAKLGIVPPVVQDDCSKQDKDDSVTADQDDSEQNIDKIEEKKTKKRRMTCIEETRPLQSDLVKSNDSDQDNDDSRSISNYNCEQSIDKKRENFFKKQRISWTGDLQQKFLKAIKLVGGLRKATPKVLLKCLQDQNIEGLTRNNVSSHLQKYRLSLEKNQIPQQFRETGWSSLRRPSPFLGMTNGFIAPSSLINGRPAVYPVQDNQYQNGYSAMTNNQFVTNNMSGFPYLNNDHHLQQQHEQPQYYQLHNQVNYMMRMSEPQQAYNGIGLPDLESSIYPSLTYYPNEFLIDGYNFSN